LPDLLTALERLDLDFLENAWMTDDGRESLARLVAPSAASTAGGSADRAPS
jgi:hypothetical protein